MPAPPRGQLSRSYWHHTKQSEWIILTLTNHDLKVEETHIVVKEFSRQLQRSRYKQHTGTSELPCVESWLWSPSAFVSLACRYWSCGSSRTPEVQLSLKADTDTPKKTETKKSPNPESVFGNIFPAQGPAVSTLASAISIRAYQGTCPLNLSEIRIVAMFEGVLV